MRIKNAEIIEKKLNQVNGETFAQISLSIEVEDDFRTSYLIELPVNTPPINTWEAIDVKSKEHSIKQSLKGRKF